jgi:endonuclease/exonuclease/phosphatase family metal-dependent hydrolase
VFSAVVVGVVMSIAALSYSLPAPAGSVSQSEQGRGDASAGSKAAQAPKPSGSPGPALTLVTWNLGWFFDWDISDNQSEVAKINSAPSRQEWEWRLDQTADALARLRAHVVCLQEIENRKVLEQLVGRIKERHKLEYVVGFVPGRDVSTEQDVAILIHTSMPARFRRASEPQQFDRDREKRVSKQLLAEVALGGRQVAIINVHLMAGNQLGNEMDRCDQARFIKRWVREEHRSGRDLILVGDMNTAMVQDARERALDVLMGRDTANDPSDNLEDMLQLLSPEDRVTFGGKRSELDHILVSPRLRSGKGLTFVNIANRRDVSIRGVGPDHRLRLPDRRFWKVDPMERDLSDHYPLMATFSVK